MNKKSIVNKIKTKIKTPVQVGIILGSGIDILPLVENPIEISYKELKMPQGKVKGHSGKFIFGSISGINVVLASRYHYYECGDMEAVRLPLYIIKELGAESVIMQSSTGALNTSLKLGDVCLVKDHINFTGNNPLIGADELKFVNMYDNYNKNYRDRVLNLNKDIKQVVHIQFNGPNYETQAEIKMAKVLGADTVSMSLLYDNLIARYLDMKVLAFAVVTNELDESKNKTLNHLEVLDVAKKANDCLVKIIDDAFKNNIFE